jgi:hypothetical protein
MSERSGGKRTTRVLKATGIGAGQVLLFLVTLILVLYFSPSVKGIQAPLLAMALEDRPVRLVFEGAVSSPFHGRVGVARPAILDDEDREILRAELIEIDGAGWRGGGPAVSSILLKKPEVNLFVAPDGNLSLMVLLKEKKRKKRRKEKGSWTVDSLRIEDGLITLDLPLVTGRVGPMQLSGNVAEVKGVSKGAVDLRIERIDLELRGPDAALAFMAALGWTPERLSTLGPVVVRATWDGNRFDVEEASFGVRPLEVSMEAHADLDALSMDTALRGTWDGDPLLQLSAGLSPARVEGAMRLDLGSFATLSPADGVTLRGFAAGPTTLEAGGRSVALHIERLGLDSLSQGDARFGDLALSGEVIITLPDDDLAVAWEAFWGDSSVPELLTRFKPTLGLKLDAGLGTLTQGDLDLAPKLRLHVDAGFTPPMRLDLRSVRLDSAFGQVRLEGRMGPKPPLGMPGYEGNLQLVGIDLAALKDHLTVPGPLERFLSGHLEGEVVFEGSPMEPQRLTLARCNFGVVDGASPLGIHCPEGGTTIDPTQAPDVGPMTLFKKEIPWGDGKLLLGPPREAAAP